MNYAFCFVTARDVEHSYSSAGVWCVRCVAEMVHGENATAATGSKGHAVGTSPTISNQNGSTGVELGTTCWTPGTCYNKYYYTTMLLGPFAYSAVGRMEPYK